jgi:putative Mg2+ transporter-C (MgtC) family protein
MDENILKIVLAIAVGAVVGAEREFHVGQGLRTITLVCLGAALFTMYSDQFDFFGQGDPRRIAAAVVTGVGFLGAGMVLRHEGGVAGLTTATAVWLVAALGMGIAIGMFEVVLVATIGVLIILWGVPLVQRLSKTPSTHTYVTVTTLNEAKYDELLASLKARGLRVTSRSVAKAGDSMTCTWRVRGTSTAHEAAARMLINDPEVNEFHAS